MGTRWLPHDEKAQEKYRRGKATAEAKTKSGVKVADVAVGNSMSVEL